MPLPKDRMQLDKQLDLSGLNCPLPILRAKKALADMTSGQVLEVIATDPGAPKDFEAFCRQTGNGLVESSTTAEGKFRLVLRRK
ncbi:TusA-related sulfurtransferase [Crenobacter luteus]|nr:TusA-related sulfurtransferase [Crenobacter luteus]